MWEEEGGGEEKGRKNGRKRREKRKRRMREEDGEGKDELLSLSLSHTHINITIIQRRNNKNKKKNKKSTKKQRKIKTHKNPLINLLSTPKIRPLRRIKRKQRFFFVKNLQFRSTRRRIPEEVVFCDEGFYGMLVTLNVIWGEGGGT